ncbi:MAG: hypothetical protein CL908_21040 [Deltaproteobacteria bacterium]|nr:hypothetical protein [Deltaproteobacteria bacterium]
MFFKSSWADIRVFFWGWTLFAAGMCVGMWHDAVPPIPAVNPNWLVVVFGVVLLAAALVLLGRRKPEESFLAWVRRGIVCFAIPLAGVIAMTVVTMLILVVDRVGSLIQVIDWIAPFIIWLAGLAGLFSFTWLERLGGGHAEGKAGVESSSGRPDKGVRNPLPANRQ